MITTTSTILRLWWKLQLVGSLDQSRYTGGGDVVDPCFFSVSSRRRKREREINLAVLGIHGDGTGLPATSEDERRRNQIQFQQIQWIPSTNKISVLHDVD